MSKSKNKTKKKFKLGSIWIFLIVVVAAILAIVFGNMIATYVSKSGGQRVFDQYMKAAASQDVEGIAKTLYAKGTDEYNDFVESYSEGKKAYAEFLRDNAPNSDAYINFMEAEFETDPEKKPDPRDLGLILAVEQQITKNIKSYSFSSHKQASYYDEFAVITNTKNPFTSSEFPQKYSNYITDSFSTPFTVKFSSAEGSWLFLSEFSLLKKLGSIETWYAPYSANGEEGVELKYLNPEDLEEMEVPDDIGGNINVTVFDATKLIKDKKILSIGDNAFEDCETMQFVALSDSLVNIGSYAFKNCKSLLSVLYESNAINDADRNIKVGAGAFYNCENLQAFTLPKINKIIPDYLFYNCYALQSFEIHDGVEAIGHYSFAITTRIFANTSIPEVKARLGLKNINIKSSVTAIGDSAFRGQANLVDINYVEGATQVVNEIRSSVVRLGSNVFSGCSSLAVIKLPENMVKIQEGTFKDCSNLTDITLPSGLKEIGRYAFSSTGLGVVSLPKSVETIGTGAFSQSESLSVIEWAQDTKIRIIGSGAFEGCLNMYEFTLPKTIKEVGSEAFKGCSKLRVVKVNCSGNISIAQDSFQYQNSIPKLYVEDTADYRGTNWSRLEIYPQSIINGDLAITNYTSVNAAGQTVTEKMLVQFLGGREVETINLDEQNIQRIGSGAFAYSQYVKDVQFNSSNITAIGENAFVGSNVTFNKILNADKDVLYYLGDWLVAAGGSLPDSKYTSVTLDLRTNTTGLLNLPQTRGIAAGVFNQLTGLKTIFFPSSLVYIGDSTFKNSRNITTVNFEGSNLKKIGANAFENCISLISLNLPASVEEIGGRAFFECNSLRFVYVNNAQRTMLGKEVFSPKQNTLKIYINGYSDNGSNYKTDAQWLTYSTIAYDNDIITGNGLFALSSNGDGTYTLIQYLGLEDENSIVNINLVSGEIDSSINVTIDSIFAGAFAMANVDKVIIPYTVKEIGNYAFFKCSTLYDVTLKANSNVDSLNRIGDFCFSQTRLDSEDGVFTIEADAPNDGFALGTNVFDNTVSRAIKVGERAKFTANNYWKNYNKAFAAIDDPVVWVKIELVNSNLINGNAIGRFAQAGVFRDYAGAPFEEMAFRATVDTDMGYKFLGWFTSDANGIRGAQPVSTDINYTATLGNSNDAQYLIAVFERTATPITLKYTSSMGSVTIASTANVVDGLYDLFRENGQEAVVTFTATPRGTNRLVGWYVTRYVDGEAVTEVVTADSTNKLTLTLEENMTVEALFA